MAGIYHERHPEHTIYEPSKGWAEMIRKVFGVDIDTGITII